AKFANRAGYYSFDFLENPSLIRGGHNVYYATISTQPVHSAHLQADLIIALNKDGVELHREELNPGAGVIFDPDEFELEPIRGKRLLPIPLKRLAEKAGGSIMANSVALGAMVWLTGGKIEILEEVLSEFYGAKSIKIGQQNAQSARLGWQEAKKLAPLNTFFAKTKKTKRMVVAGNEAIGAGAIGAGMQFAAIYPMTPISSVLVYLAKHEQEAGIVVRQPEDEIAGINMALGASFAGVRSMVATSGGGFALMSETLSLAGLTETPVVVVYGQRAGPATGIPTWTAQEDLLFALTAAQGEYPRIVLAPGDAAECFSLTVEAFDLADFYQTPVIVLADKLVCEGHQSLDSFDWGKIKLNRGKLVSPLKAASKTNALYPRYRVTKDGISPRAYPAVGVLVKANSDEHDQFGLSVETSENRNAQVEKRMRKVGKLADQWPTPKVYGPDRADLTLVGWGSVKGPVLQALNDLKGSRLEGKVNFLHLNRLRPFPAKQVTGILEKAKKTLLLENNFQGQLGQWLRLQTGIELSNRFLKYSGRQFYPEEVARRIGKEI
ncbi:2-oxoacid:acceptor oxidoreductase subunit alpha, partial [Patescibacteria group bacterium]|nr:2-oxoacid:acceptor oxidoreductase subunit alpha [Patescibacteria group bacterium]